MTALPGPLAAARQEMATVVSLESLPGGMVELSVRAPQVAAAAKPGQFAMVRCAPSLVPLLRRPFSIAWVEHDAIAFVFLAAGEGTRRLASLKRGQQVDVLGPLGRGFALDGLASGSITELVCVSGGLGCAPFPLLAASARALGAHVTVLSGAASAARLYPAERFRRGDDGIDVVETTDDGSQGAQGFVTALLARHLDGAVAPAAMQVAGCGPNPMLSALAAVLAARLAPARAQVSLEAPMGCGLGTCLGCALPVVSDAGGAWELCCREGPVMEVEHVDWSVLGRLPGADVA